MQRFPLRTEHLKYIILNKTYGLATHQKRADALVSSVFFAVFNPDMWSAASEISAVLYLSLLKRFL